MEIQIDEKQNSINNGTKQSGFEGCEKARLFCKDTGTSHIRLAQESSVAKSDWQHSTAESRLKWLG